MNTLLDIPALEEHLQRHPGSPLFARLASEYSSRGRNAEAIDLCRAGLILFPSYATGHLVLAKCYAREAHYALALVSLEEARKNAGNFPGYKPLLDSWTSLLSGAPESSQPPAQTREFTPPTTAAPAELVLRDEPVQPIVEFTTPVEPESPILPQDSPPAVEALQTVAPPPDISTEELAQIQRPAASDSEDGRIISKTLAEIFATQGEFDEAIVTYRLLLQVRPDIEDEILRRLEELARLRDEKAAQLAAQQAAAAAAQQDQSPQK